MLPAGRKRAAGDSRPRWEVADIFRHYGEAYRHSHALPRSHLKVMQAIEVCRTAYLGGHIEQCDCCGFQRQAYNSCLPVRAARRQAATAIALNVSRWPRLSGCNSERPSCYPSATSIWSLLSLTS